VRNRVVGALAALPLLLAPVGCARTTSMAPAKSSRVARKADCSDRQSLESSLARVTRERERIRGELAAAGFERTTAETAAFGTPPADLALQAARSASGLEQALEGRTPAFPGLRNQIDWIAANLYDPVLGRWTAAQARALAALSQAQFEALKTDVNSLRQTGAEAASAADRLERLPACSAPKRRV
jgi:hypothetical protein